jgi:hypothetical protein
VDFVLAVVVALLVGSLGARHSSFAETATLTTGVR